MNYIKNLKLKWKFVVPMLLLALIPLIIVSFYAIEKSKNSLKENIGENFVTLSSQILNKLDNTLSSVANTFELEAENEIMDDIMTGDIDSRISSRIAKIKTLNKIYNEIIVTDGGGHIISATNSAYVGKSYQNMLNIKETKIMFGEEPLKGKRTIVLATPVKASYDPDTILGNIIGIIEVTEIKKMIQAIKIGDMSQSEDFFVSLINYNTGNIIIEPVTGNTALIKTFNEKTKDGKAGYSEMSDGDTSYLVAHKSTKDFTYLKDLEGLLFVAENQSIAFAAIYSLRFNIQMIILFVVVLIVFIAFRIAKLIVDPIVSITDGMKHLAAGDFDVEIDLTSEDEIGILAESFRSVKNLISDIQNSIGGIEEAIAQGKLTERMDADNLDGSWKTFATGINSLVEAFVMPINLTSEYVDRISAGDLPEKIVQKFSGDFNNIKHSLNLLIGNLSGFNNEVTNLYRCQSEGDVDALIDSSQFQGVYREMAEGVNEMTSGLNGIIVKILDIIGEYGAGNFDASLESLPGKRAIANEKIDAVRTNLINVQQEVFTLIEHAKNGLLKERASGKKLEGNWKNLIEGINEIVDAFVHPLNNSISVLSRMAMNDYTTRIEGEYKGSYAELVASINNVIDRITKMQDITINLANGDLGDLMDLKKIGKRCENDHLVPSFIVMMEAVVALVDDANVLAQSAEEGKLSTRANPEHHKGEYKNVISGLNDIMENLVRPLESSAKYIENTAKGIKNQTITDEAKGDYNRIKDNMNILTDKLELITDGILGLSRAAVEGNLEHRIDNSAFEGVWIEMTTGINSAVDNILKPVNEAVGVIKKMAAGDLTAEMAGAYQGDHAVLKNSLNETLTSLNSLLLQVNNAVDQVSAGSGQVSDASQTLSHGATQQAASLEQVSSAMQEIGSQAKLNADNSSQASKLSKHARDNAEVGNKQMELLNTAMADINESSDQIKKVIKVIDDIAFQTNLLAINAAVEAARAGVHGKGFAVVATEVRTLAQKSAKAAKETTELIEGSVVQASKGNKITADTAESLKKIVGGIVKVSDIVEEISTASDEQARGVGQINDGITQVDHVTQQNAANAEETASASVELSSQASELRRMISRFKLKNSNDGFVSSQRRNETTMIDTNRDNSQLLLENDSSSSCGEHVDIEMDDFGEF